MSVQNRKSGKAGLRHPVHDNTQGLIFKRHNGISSGDIGQLDYASGGFGFLEEFQHLVTSYYTEQNVIRADYREQMLTSRPLFRADQFTRLLECSVTRQHDNVCSHDLTHE